VKPSRFLPLLALLVVSALPLQGQEAESGQVCVVFPVKDLSAGAEARDYEQTITEAVAAAFTAANFRVLPSSSWQDAADSRAVDLGQPLSEPDALAIARSVGADIAVTGVYSVRDDEVYYSIQCWDVAKEKLAAGLQARTPFNLAFFSGLNIALTSELLPRLAAQGPQVPRVVFTSADEGMSVKLSDDQDIGRITNGLLTMPASSIVPGTRVLLEKSRPGYHPGEQTVTLTAARQIPLTPLVKEYRRGMELNATVGQLLGLGVALRDYRVPDWFFVIVGGYLWVQPPLNFAPRVVLHVDMSGGVGGYLFLKPDAPVRLGVSTGAGLILSFPSTVGLPVYTDFYLDVINLWVEATLFGTTLYVRQEYKYALGMGTNLLGQGMMVPDFPPTTLGVLFRW
jgi:hypothetical protein